MHVMSVDATVQPEKKPNTLRNKVITRGRNASGTSFGCETRSTIHSYITLSHQRHGRCFSSLLMGRENTLSGPDRLLSWPPYRTANAQALGLLESFLGKRSIVQAEEQTFWVLDGPRIRLLLPKLHKALSLWCGGQRAQLHDLVIHDEGRILQEDFAEWEPRSYPGPKDIFPRTMWSSS